MAERCGRTGCLNEARRRCVKCGVAYCDDHLIPSESEAGVYRCPECDRYVRSLMAGKVVSGRKTPR